MIKFSKIKNKNKGGMSFELEIILFVIAIFVIWVLSGGSNKPVEDKPFIVPFTDTVDGGTIYNNTDLSN